MSERRRPTEPELEAMLADLADHVDYPGAPELAGRVAADIRSGRERRRRWALVPPRRALAPALLALLLLAAALLALSPGARTAVAGWLGLPGVHIETGGSKPPAGLGRDLRLGEPVTLSEGQDAVVFDILQPSPATLGAPDEVYLGYPPAGGRVSLLYRPRPGLPAARGSRVGLLLTQFEATMGADLLAKNTFGGTRLEPVAVGHDRGFWISGRPHVLLLRAPDGSIFEDQARLAGNTLLWLHDGVTLRLESGLSKQEALQIAKSVRPRPES